MLKIIMKCIECGKRVKVEGYFEPVGDLVLAVYRDCDCKTYKEGYDKGIADAQDNT